MPARTCETKKLVLIVEDDFQLAAGTRACLERAGLECRVADTLDAAFRRISADRPDFIISDFNLPDGTAEDLLHWLWSTPSPPPVLLCTAAPRAHLAAVADHPLVRGIFTKPVSTPSLLRAIADRMPVSRNPMPRVRPLIGAPERRQLLGELPCG
jgi:DNA-binding NtrC family response regulator